MKIDKLEPGTTVTLGFEERGGNLRLETAGFVRIVGEGEDRRATFTSIAFGGDVYDWDAYRYCGRWVYGSSAQRLRLVNLGALDERTVTA